MFWAKPKASFRPYQLSEPQPRGAVTRRAVAPAKTDDEPRFLVIGKIGGNHWAAVCAHRGDNVRIISVRRARKQEIDHYESN